MYFYTMTITEDVDSQYRSELKLWENTDHEIWIQIGYDDEDPCTIQGMAIDTDDAKALIHELTRLVKSIESRTPQPLPEVGQQLTIQKVNWSK